MRVVFAWSGVPTLNLARPRESWVCAQVRNGTRRVLEKIFQDSDVYSCAQKILQVTGMLPTSKRLRARSGCACALLAAGSISGGWTNVHKLHPEVGLGAVYKGKLVR